MDYDKKVCSILEDLDKCVFDYLKPSHGETQDNEDSLMDGAVLPYLLMNKDANNTTNLDSQKNDDIEQNIDRASETLLNQTLVSQSLCHEEDILNQSDGENSSSKQTDENFQYESSDRSEEMRYKSDRIDVLVILENDRRKVINVKRYSKVKHLKKKFLKIVQKDSLYTDKIDEGSEIIFQTYHDKFKAWVDAEQDLILTDGLNLKAIFATTKTQKEKESKRSYIAANSEDHDDVKNYSTYKSKKLKSSISHFEKTWSQPVPSRSERSRSPPSRLLKSIQSYTYYERRNHKGERSEKAWRTSNYDYESGRGNPRKSYFDDYNRGKTYNGVHQVSTTSYNKTRPAYNKLPHSSYEQNNKTKSYSEELNNFLKMVEKQKTEKNEPSTGKIDNEETLENNSEIEEGEVKCVEINQLAVVENIPCEEEVQYILLSKKEIELYSARLRISEKHPVQAVQEICASVYKKAPVFDIHEERCPQTKLMRYKYTLNVLGNIFTPETTQFNKKAAKVDAATLFLKHVGFK